MNEMTEEERQYLRKLGERQVAVICTSPHWHGLRDDLIANAESWRLGFDQQEFVYWVTPRCLRDGDEWMLPGPFNVLKWDYHDFQAIHKHRFGGTGT